MIKKKNSPESECRGTKLNMIKTIYDNPQQTSFSVAKTESISSKIRNKTRRSTHTTIIQHSFRCSNDSNQSRKMNKNNSSWKPSKTVTADDMMLCLENHNDVKRKLLEFINEFGNIAGYKMNKRNLLNFCTLTVKNQKEKLRNQSHLSSQQQQNSKEKPI